MIKALLASALLFASLWGQNHPNLYPSLGNKLFDANAKFEAFLNYETLAEKVRSYNADSKSLREQGLSLESKGDITSDERNKYLASLRVLENDYITIIHDLQQMLLDSIRGNDYGTFVRISNSTIADLWQSHTIQRQAIAYYQQNKDKGNIDSLEQLIHNKKLEREAEMVQAQEENGVYISKKPVRKSGTVVDQEHFPVGGRGGLEITGNQTVAQSFTVTRRGRLIALDLIDIKHHRCAPTTSLHTSLVNMQNDRLGPYSYYTRELHPNEISPTTKLYFGHYGPIVKPGERYAIFLKTNAEPGGCTYAWSGDYETYNGGKTFINEIENIRDMKFRTYILMD